MTDLPLFDAPGDTVAEITTDGSTIKPFLNAVNQLVDKARIQFEETGLYVNAVDPANVGMITAHLDAAEFVQYDLEGETTVGVNLNKAKKLVRRARKGKDDELQLHVQEHELTATVSRGYEHNDVVSQGTMQLIDPDSLRAAEELPEFETQTVELSADVFTDALSYAMGPSDYVEFKVQAVNQHAHALYIGGETDTREEHAAITNIDAEETEDVLYSNDYLKQLLGAISDVDPREVTLELAGEFPLLVTFKSDGLSVEYAVAPRIQQ